METELRNPKAAFRAWYEKNRDANCAKVRNYYHQNKEHALVVREAYRLSHYDAECSRKRGEYTRRHGKDPWINLLKSCLERAKLKNLPFDLTPEWAASVWTGCCAVSGIPFVSGVGLGNRGPRPYSPSVDRKNPCEGYTQSNCRFVLMAVNALKGAGAEEDMYRIAGAIWGNRPV